jgi:hypothetical protein
MSVSLIKLAIFEFLYWQFGLNKKIVSKNFYLSICSVIIFYNFGYAFCTEFIDFLKKRGKNNQCICVFNIYHFIKLLLWLTILAANASYTKYVRNKIIFEGAFLFLGTCIFTIYFFNYLSTVA